jgi:hypothetical protein
MDLIINISFLQLVKGLHEAGLWKCVVGDKQICVIVLNYEFK